MNVTIAPMQWIVFSYSLPSQSRSSPRVALWRRLRRLGAISPAGGVYVLPGRDECVEAFQWLAQEIRQAHGDALVMRVEQFEGLDQQQLIGLFNAARREEYDELDAEAAIIEETLGKERTHDETIRLQDVLTKLRRRYNDISRVDYFTSPEGATFSSRLARIAQGLAADPSSVVAVASASLEEYRTKQWITRPRPHVDRLACSWLIRQFINPTAVIRYGLDPQPDEVAFDMRDGQFGHQGNFCTFETMLRAFGLDEPDLQVIAEIVHEIDLRDGRYVRPETAGIDIVLNGWLLLDIPDEEREARGVSLFEGLYAAVSDMGSKNV
jgi:hypothetical protein